jgi:hypothetical protein
VVEEPREGKLRFAGSMIPTIVAVPPHGEMGGKFAIVRALPRGHAVELQVISTNGDRLPRLELGNPLDAPLRLANNTEEREPEPEMRKRSRPRPSAASPARAQTPSERHFQQTRALHDLGQGAGHDVEGKTDRERHQDRTAAFHGERPPRP